MYRIDAATRMPRRAPAWAVGSAIVGAVTGAGYWATFLPVTRPILSFRFALLAAGALAATGCAPDPDNSAVAAQTPGEGSAAEVVVGTVVQVQALDNTFREKDVTIARGTEVVWTNVGRNDHDVQPDDAVPDEAVPDDEGEWGVEAVAFAPGATFSHVFDAPGVYHYLCTIHGVAGRGMVGTITVTS